TRTDRELGAWTNADLIAFVEEVSELFTERMRRYGQTEFLSSYHGYVQDILIAILLHAPTQRLYDAFAHTYDRMVFDLVANFHAGCGTFPGPSGRSYDL